jgi:hypothetical protein
MLPSYTSWWLRTHPVLGGRRPAEMRAAQANPLLAGLYDEVELPAGAEFARALGVRTSLAELLGEPGGPDELLTRLADPARSVTRSQLRALWIALAAVADVELPDRVRAVRRDDVVAADAAEALTSSRALRIWTSLMSTPVTWHPAAVRSRTTGSPLPQPRPSLDRARWRSPAAAHQARRAMHSTCSRRPTSCRSAPTLRRAATYNVPRIEALHAVAH